MVYKEQGKYKEAITHYKETLRIQPGAFHVA
jgi:hypothetical protein